MRRRRGDSHDDQCREETVALLALQNIPLFVLARGQLSTKPLSTSKTDRALAGLDCRFPPLPTSSSLPVAVRAIAKTHRIGRSLISFSILFDTHPSTPHSFG